MTLSEFKLLFAVFFATAALYCGSTRFAFINLDDRDYIELNDHMRAGLTPANAHWAFTNCGYAENWHPLTWLSMMGDVSLDRALRGGAVADDVEWTNRDSRLAHLMHAHNVILHAANAALLCALLLLLSRGSGLAPVWSVALALLWSFHPLRVEAVCWVTERKELLSVFFMLLTLLCAFRESRIGREILALLFYGAALLSKPVAVSLPAVILAWDWVLHGRIRVVRFAAYAILAVAVSVLTILAQSVAIETGARLSGLSHLTSIFAAPVIYLRQTFYPVGLSLTYGEVSRGEAILLIALGITLLLTMIVVCLSWMRKSTPLKGILVFAIAWVYVGLVPMLGIVKVGSQEHSDRYTYWIGCGLSAMAVLALAHLRPHKDAILVRLGCKPGEWNDLRRLIHGGLVVVLVVFSYLTFGQISHWRDAVSIYRRSVPYSWSPEITFALAKMLNERGNKEEAERWLRECADRRPCVETYLNLVEVLLTKPVDSVALQFGDRVYVEEDELLSRALAKDPDNERGLKLKGQIEAVQKNLKTPH